VPGLIFHYPYYTGFPAQAIRVGDYKLLRQLNTGEIRLHNLAEDVGEKVNLAKEMPEKVKELDGILQKYLKEVGAQKIEEVYAAREKELLGYQSNIREQYIPRLEKLLADPKKTAAEKKAVRDRIEQFKTEELPRLQKQYEGVAKNRKNAQW